MLRCEALHEADQCGPLQRVADAACERCHARQGERGRERHAEEGGAEREHARAQNRAKLALHQSREDHAREDRARAPRRDEQAVAAIAAVQGRLHVRDLDRSGRLHEAERDELGQQQRPQRGYLVDVLPGRA